MTTNGGKISPEVEFGTFLRLPHQTRTFSRPADSYIPSSPPSRPTSPIPAATPTSPVLLHGRPAPIVGKMRQGAPRLGGLGLGGILEAPSPTPPAPPPPLPARRQPLSTSPKRSSLPPAVPPVSSLSSSSRSASPASSLEARPRTPTTAPKPESTEDGVIQRPFLSPEMEKPTVREGAFALDRPKVESVLRNPANDDDDTDDDVEVGPRPTELDAGCDPSDEGTEPGPGPLPEVERDREAASPEAFPSPAFAEEENVELFDRFKSALVKDDDVSSVGVPAKKGPGEDEQDSDRASVDSAGESLFATPETVAALEEDDDEPIPVLDLQHPVAAVESDGEEIAFDGPTQLVAEDVVAEAPQVRRPLDESTDSQEATPHLSQPSTFEPAAIPAAPIAVTSLAESLISRADKSTTPGDVERSPAVSVATSVYNSREPSVYDLQLEQDEAEEALGEEAPSGLDRQREESTETNPVPNLEGCGSSPAYSQGSTLPDELSPAYLQGSRHLDDPASQYPSPPSSPATSIQDSTFPHDDEGNLVPDDSSIYSIEQPAKISAHDSEFVEEVREAPIESESAPAAPALARTSSFEYDESVDTGSRSAIEQTYAPPPVAAAPVSPPSVTTPSPTASPYFDRSVPASGRRSRFSYQGLGLRMPSSIAPKSAVDQMPSDGDSERAVAPIVGTSQARASVSEPSVVTEGSAETAGQAEVTGSPSKPLLFPWIRESSGSVQDAAKESVATGYSDHDSSPSSPSAYAPSSVASSPEITQAYRVPISSPPVGPVVSPLPVLSSLPIDTPTSVTPATPPISAPTTASPVSRSDVSSEAAIVDSSEVVAQTPAAIGDDEPPEPASLLPGQTAHELEGEGGGDPDQNSTVGVAVDIGTAVAGALVMGGLAVGQSAWRGLAVGWSAWRGASNQSVMPPTEIVQVSDVVPKEEIEDDAKGFKSYARPKDEVEESEGSKRAESSVLSTEWGEAEFEAPEGFLEEFKRAMAEIGEEDLAANEQAQVQAQLAAYQAASRQHVDAVSSPTLSDNSSLASNPSSSGLAFPSARGTRQRESSAFRSQPETIQEDSADEDERELEDLLAPVWDSPSRASRIASDFPTRHGFAPPPGLTGSPTIGGRPTSVISTSSIGSAPGTPTSKQGPSSPKQPVKLSKTSKGILGFGRSKSTKNVPSSPKPSSRIVPSPSLPGLTKSPSSVMSKESLTVNGETASQTSSHKTAGRRSSIFNFGGGGGKDVPPVPTIESQIKDTTYISYGRAPAKPERRTSNASSIPAGLYASRDPYLVVVEPGPPTTTSSPARPAATSNNGRSRETTRSSVMSWASSSTTTTESENATVSNHRSERGGRDRRDVGGAPLGRRKSSLRATSAYDVTTDRDRDGNGGAPLERRSSSIIVEGGKKLYRVRFGNAVGGIGLRSVADSEAERAGGDRYGQRWVGVGRGRYGNMVIKTDEESDMVYAEQVAQIKKKWRAFGSEQSRDWAAVRIDK